MINFLLKICAFVFASTHLSFLPYCQVYQPEQQKKSSIMPSNSINERTYIMVKVRFRLAIIVLPPPSSIPFVGLRLIEEDRIGLSV